MDTFLTPNTVCRDIYNINELNKLEKLIMVFINIYEGVIHDQCSSSIPHQGPSPKGIYPPREN